MDIDSCYQLGYVIKPHGLKGEVSIYIDADEPQAYRKLESVLIQQDNNLVPFFIAKIKISGQKAILRLEESTTIESAQSLKGSALFLPLTALPVLTDYQFYFHEIIGFIVQDENLGEIGPVLTVYDAGPQDLLAIEHKGKEILLPINDETVRKADKNKKLIFVNIPDGLLDIYLSDQDRED
jgi:16S rRNA processing protein RimM